MSPEFDVEPCLTSAQSAPLLDSPDLPQSLPQVGFGRSTLQWLAVGGMVYLLLGAVDWIELGFRVTTGERAETLFAFATNPFLGLLVGLGTTALIQSSSTVTSIIVALVAGGLPVGTAVPMIMGSNLGTTITNTLVSLGHIGDREQFRRAFAAATVHDFFNLLAVTLFLPVEILWHPLEKLADALADRSLGLGHLTLGTWNPIAHLTLPWIQIGQILSLRLPGIWGGLLLVGIGVGLIFVAIAGLGHLLKQRLVGRAEAILHRAIGQHPLTGIAAGTLITLLVQSSSTTTSLMVPLAGNNIFSLAEVYPFTLGANIGTCITALLAATAITGATAVPALTIALVHLLFNCSGVLVIYATPFLRPLPLWGAETLAKVASEKRFLAIVYIVVVFFAVPIVALLGFG